MKEILVVVSCLYDKGCTEAARQYFNTEPSIQIVAANIEAKGKNVLGPVVSEYGVPILAYAIGKDLNVRLTDIATIKLNKQSFGGTLTWSF